MTVTPLQTTSANTDTAVTPSTIGSAFVSLRTADGALEIGIHPVVVRALAIKWLIVGIMGATTPLLWMALDPRRRRWEWVALVLIALVPALVAAHRTRNGDVRWSARPGHLAFSWHGMFGMRQRIYGNGRLLYRRDMATDFLRHETADGRRTSPWVFHLFWLHMGGSQFLHGLAKALADETGFDMVEDVRG